jgi:hypothetical protein
MHLSAADTRMKPSPLSVCRMVIDRNAKAFTTSVDRLNFLYVGVGEILYSEMQR